MALIIFYNIVIDLAITTTGYGTDAGSGLAGYVVALFAFRARFGGANPDPIQEPAAYQGDAAAIKNIQRQWELFELQEHSAAALRIAIINALPLYMRLAIQVNDSLAHLETREILVRLLAAFP